MEIKDESDIKEQIERKSEVDSDCELEEEIEDEKLEERYRSVKSYSDLIDINIDFLLNKVPYSYYYHGPFGDCADHAPRRSYLVDLHRLFGVYSINGQSNINEECYIQHSYLDFVVKPSLATKLTSYLLSHPELYTCISTTEHQYDNFPSEVFDLTKYRQHIYAEWEGYSRWRRNIKWFGECLSRYDNVNDILRNCVMFVIAVKSPETSLGCASREADEILREILDVIHDA